MDALKRFSSQAETYGVPVGVVVDAAAHTWEMLGPDQQAEIVGEALARWKAAKEMSEAHLEESAVAHRQDSVVVREGDTTTVFVQRRNTLRDDLVYRLMHERFDAVYAIALRAADAPEGSEHAEWLFVPPRPTEQETPVERSARMIQALMVGLRRAKQRCESLRASALRHLSAESR